MTKPTIVIVPGFWEGPQVFDAVVARLRANGFDTTVAPLASTGNINPAGGSPAPYTMDKDIQGIRAVVEPLVVEQGKDVVMVLHSAGGFLGSSALEGLSRRARSEQGLPGGVTKIVFVAAGVAPVGSRHATTPEDGKPFFDCQGDRMWCVSPRELLFNEIADDEEAEKHVRRLSNQPTYGWEGVVTYAGWKEVPSLFLVCEKDMVLVKDMQMEFARRAGSEVLTCDAGHMPQLTQPDLVARVVTEAAST